jgi:hypothetical protein
MKKIVLPGLVAGVVMLVSGLLFNVLFNSVFPGVQSEYINPIFRPWSDPLMSLIFVQPFVLGFLLAWLWATVKCLIKDPISWRRGMSFAFSYWIVCSIPGMIMSYSSFNISLMMTLSWTLTGLVQVICASLVLSVMNK